VAHSKFSASAAERWLQCPGSVVLSVGRTDKQSKAAARGTAVHKLLENALNTGADPHAAVGTAVEGVRVTMDMADDAEWAAKHTRDMAAGCDMMQAETLTDYAAAIGAPAGAAFGTADVTLVDVKRRELIVADLKSGQKPVSPAGNPQMMLYALGKLADVQDVADIETARLVILQPSAGAPKEHVISVRDLRAWANGRARSGVASVLNAERLADRSGTSEWQDAFLRPSDDACRWCKAAPVCPKKRAQVAQDVFEAPAPATAADFDDMTAPPVEARASTDAEWLAAARGKIDTIRAWCDAVEETTRGNLLAGQHVPGYKLVQGRGGHRAWLDEAATRRAMATAGVPDEAAYAPRKLASPAQVEAWVKKTKPSPRVWLALSECVKHPAPVPVVAPNADPRDAWTRGNVADEFDGETP
jgi:Protein of unknown function (DUF2800)